MGAMPILREPTPADAATPSFDMSREAWLGLFATWSCDTMPSPELLADVIARLE
jgi:hypothetical protein